MAGISGYFDYAAATPMDPKVKKAMEPYFSANFYNPSATYEPGRNVKKSIENARLDAAQLLGVKPAEIIFTAGGTEANNLAISGVMSNYPSGNIIISAIEHDSVLQPSENFDSKICPVDTKGILNIDKFSSLIDQNTVLVSVMIANNEIGSIQPIRKISHIIQQVRIDRKKSGNPMPIYLHTDAAQAVNYLDLHVNRLGVDMMSLNGGKIYGPKQSGLLYLRGGIQIKAQILGGGQERSLRSGTENVPGIIGLVEAMKLAVKLQADEIQRCKKFQAHFISELSKKIPEAQINGSQKKRLPNNVHISLPGQDNERLLILLDQEGFYAAAGSACSASHEEPSHVLKAIGLDEQQIRSSLRFTFGRHTQSSDIDNLVSCLASILA